ncbi:hypothetical protein GCM10022206_62090 [Streptomyces chiangmaiensis]
MSPAFTVRRRRGPDTARAQASGSPQSKIVELNMLTDPTSWHLGSMAEVSPAAAHLRRPDAAIVSGASWVPGDGSAR